MAKQNINVGSSPNDRSGDSLRSAFQKINANFTELYTALGLDVAPLNLGAFEFTGSTLSTTDSSAITIDQATTVTSNLTVGGDLLPSVANGGDLGSPAKPWRSLYVSLGTIYINNVPITLNASNNLTVDGAEVVSSSTSDRFYNLNGTAIENSDITHGATSRVSVPENGSNDSIVVLNYYGGVSITAGTGPDNTHTWNFNTDGSITFPDGSVQTTAYDGENLEIDGGNAFTVYTAELEIDGGGA